MISQSVDIRLISISDKLGSRNEILFYVSDHHSFVILNHHDAGKVVVADGIDRYINDLKVREELDALIGEGALALPFDQRYYADYCGSSAALSTVELLRTFSSGGEFGDRLWVRHLEKKNC